MRSLFIVALTVIFFGCGTKQEETTTRGNLHIYIPESIAPTMIDEVNAFLGLYSQNGAKVSYTLTTSAAAAKHFVLDTARIAFLTHPLAQEEKEKVKLISPDFNEIIVAYDGIAVVVHQKNSVEKITTTEIQKILTRKIIRWNQLANAGSMKGNINVYCHDSSDVTMYLVQRLVKQSGITVNFKHTISDLQTLQSTEKDPLALGFVGLSWIDSAKASIKILDLGRTNDDTDTTFAPPQEIIGKFFSIDRAYIFLNYYPLKRAIYMYTRGKVDLAGGFGTFVATTEGQNLLSRHGLLSGTQRIKLKSNRPF